MRFVVLRIHVHILLGHQKLK